MRAFVRRKPRRFNGSGKVCAALAFLSLPTSGFFSVCQNTAVGHLHLTNGSMVFGGSVVNRCHGEKQQRVLDEVRPA
jgi:hypothetical protein